MNGDMLPFTSMLGMTSQTMPNMNPVQPGMQSVTDPNAAAPLALMHRPVQSPDELTARKSGWQVLQEKLSDPNLLRALGFAGAAMAMPGGSVGHGLATGLTAFTGGEFAARRQAVEEERLGLEKQQVGAQVERAGAETALAKARIPGVEAESKVTAGTAEDRIAKARTERQTAELTLKSATGEAEVTAIERQVRQRRAELEKGIPDAKVKSAILAELEATELKVKEARQRIAGAVTKEAIEKVTLDELKKMPDEEKRQFLTRSGKYSAAAGSAIMQQSGMWGQIYDKLPADDPNKKGKTREQFQMTMLSSTKAKDITDMMKNYVMAAIDPDPEILQMFSDILKQNLGARKGSAPAAERPAETGWQDAGTGFEYRIKKDGTREVRRKSAPTREFEGSPNIP